MTTTVLRAVKFMETKVDQFRDNRSVFVRIKVKRVEEALKFWVFLAGPILLPIVLIYLESQRY